MNGSVAMRTAPGHAASAAPGAKAGDRSRHEDAPVLIMAGGTGGHIFPGIAVAQELRDRGVPVVWLGSDGGLETRLVPQAGIGIETIPISGLRGKGIGKRATFGFLYYAFMILNLNKVYIHSRDINMSNLNLNSRFGFELEGVFFEDLKVGDQRQDVVRMALFKSLWLQIFSRPA